MDPNETLRLLRLTIKQLRVDEDTDVWEAHANEICEYFEELDDWLSRGGFPPEAWREGPDAVGEDSAGSGAALSRMAMGRDDDYRLDALGTLTCPIHGIVPEQDGGGCRLCDEGEVPDNG